MCVTLSPNLSYPNEELVQNRGVLTKWNDDRGFGFIKHNEAEMVFIHISAVKMMPRRPREGDFLFYDLIIDSSGKKKAACVTIEGLQKNTISMPRVSKKNKYSKSNYSYATLIIILAALFFYFKNYYFGFGESGYSIITYSENIQGTALKVVESRFTCKGKTYCSEMTSCEEAEFYLKNCPNQNTDGNGDGEPCESQWCN
jgi:cold shock CspA family protein